MSDDERPRPRLWLRSGNGLYILTAASKAAGKGGWSHQEWRDFSKSARSKEWPEMFELVKSRFDVQCAPTFSDDPDNWQANEAPNPMDDEGTDE